MILRSSTIAAPSQKVKNDHEGAGNPRVELAAVAASAHIEVTTSDLEGDHLPGRGKPVAEGARTPPT